MSMIAARKEDKLVNYLCMTGHICADINQGALSATLPFLVMYDGYSYTAVAGLVFAANIASAVIQPLFGAIGDHRACPWFMALGVFLAGLGMCGVGFFDAYWTVLASAMVSGIGVAMFHPEGGRLSNLAAGARKANGMSIFAVGGNIGFFVGPLMAAVFLTAFGMHGTLAFLFPTTICAIVLLAFNKRFLSLGIRQEFNYAERRKTRALGKFRPRNGRAFMPIDRRIRTYGIYSVVLRERARPWRNVRLAHAFGIRYCGSRCNGDIGRITERAACSESPISVSEFSLYAWSRSPFNRSLVSAVVLVCLLTCAANLFYPSFVALGMSYVPRHLGTASGISYGVVICVGGIVEPLLGMAGDAYGLPLVMLIIAGVTVIGLGMVAIVKRHN